MEFEKFMSYALFKVVIYGCTLPLWKIEEVIGTELQCKNQTNVNCGIEITVGVKQCMKMSKRNLPEFKL